MQTKIQNSNQTKRMCSARQRFWATIHIAEYQAIIHIQLELDCH